MYIYLSATALLQIFIHYITFFFFLSEQIYSHQWAKEEDEFILSYISLAYYQIIMVY